MFTDPYEKYLKRISPKKNIIDIPDNRFALVYYCSNDVTLNQSINRFSYYDRREIDIDCRNTNYNEFSLVFMDLIADTLSFSNSSTWTTKVQESTMSLFTIGHKIYNIGKITGVKTFGLGVYLNRSGTQSIDSSTFFPAKQPIYVYIVGVTNYTNASYSANGIEYITDYESVLNAILYTIVGGN